MARQPQIPVGGGVTQWNKLTMWLETPTKTIQEQHWLSVQGFITNGSVDFNKVVAVVAQRCACLPGDCAMIKWTLSCENVWRDAIGPSAPIPQAGLTGQNENLGNDDLNILFTAGPPVGQYRRNMFLSCIPDANVTSDGWVPGAATGFFTPLTQYLNTLAAYSADTPPAGPPFPTQTYWGYLAQDKSSACPVVTVLSYAITVGSTYFTVNLSASPNVANGDVVRITGAQGASSVFPVNQLWTVLDASDSPVIVLQAYPFTVASTPLVPRGGTLQKVNRVFRAYANWSVTGPGKHNRGNRALQPLGRKKRRYNIGFPG